MRSSKSETNPKSKCPKQASPAGARAAVRRAKQSQCAKGEDDAGGKMLGQAPAYRRGHRAKQTQLLRFWDRNRDRTGRQSPSAPAAMPATHACACRGADLRAGARAAARCAKQSQFPARLAGPAIERTNKANLRVRGNKPGSVGRRCRGIHGVCRPRMLLNCRPEPITLWPWPIPYPVKTQHTAKTGGNLWTST